jgi:WD40 repeat protein
VGTPCAFFAPAEPSATYLRHDLIYEKDQNKPGEIWAIAISADGQYLAGSSINGKINVWSLNKSENMPKIREYETKGSFGLCVDLVRSEATGPKLTTLLTQGRVATAASQPRATKTAPSTSLTTRLAVSHTPSPASSIPSVASPSLLRQNSSLPAETRESLPYTTSRLVNKSQTSQAMEAGYSRLTGVIQASIFCLGKSQFVPSYYFAG